MMSDDLSSADTRSLDDATAVKPLSGVDRGGLGQKGWAEVPEDLVGGHPELELEPAAGPDGDLNGPKPYIDPRTGGPITEN